MDIRSGKGTGREHGVLLGDEFFFVAHDGTTGKSRLHTTASGLGFAAALLAELLFVNRITIQSANVAVIDNRPRTTG